MLLFTKSSHAGLLSGAITITFRAWDKPRVKVGGRYRCHPIGVLEVDAIDRVCVSDIDESDAKRAGFESREALTTYLSSATGKPISSSTSLYRVVLHHAGDGDR